MIVNNFQDLDGKIAACPKAKSSQKTPAPSDALPLVPILVSKRIWVVQLFLNAQAILVEESQELPPGL